MSFVEDTFFGGAERKAGRDVRKAQQAAGRLTAEQLAQTEEEFQPFTTQGPGLSLQKQQAFSGALGPNAQALAFQEFQEDPGTQFLREQGLRGIESGAGVRGGLGGGDRLRELTKFSQGLALQQLSNRFNQLGATAGGEEAVIDRRQQAVSGLANLRAGFGTQQAGTIIGAGQARAGGRVGQAAGVRGGLQQVAGAVSGAVGGGAPGGAGAGIGGLQGFFGV